MAEWEADVAPAEVVGWAERNGDLAINAWKTYSSTEDFDREAYGVGDEEDLQLTTVTAALDLSPVGGRSGWTLRVQVSDVAGVHLAGEEPEYEDEFDLPLAAFTSEFLSRPEADVGVVVLADTPAAWARFNGWLARRRAEDRAASTGGSA